MLNKIREQLGLFISISLENTEHDDTEGTSLPEELFQLLYSYLHLSLYEGTENKFKFKLYVYAQNDWELNLWLHTPTREEFLWEVFGSVKDIETLSRRHTNRPSCR